MMDTLNETKMNEITLKYLMNPSHYERYYEENPLCNEDFLTDKKFYRKRIIGLTKDMFKDNFENDHIKGVFDLYIKNLISYFKEIDTKDIIQKEYKHLVLPSNTADILNEKAIDDANAMIFVEPKPPTLDTFVNIVRTKRDDEILPLKKEIDLKDPKLRKKGVKKKDTNKDTNVTK